MMKKTLYYLIFGSFLILQVFTANYSYGQIVENVIIKHVSAYENKSYRATKSVTLLPGFTFAATPTQSFSIVIIPQNQPSQSLNHMASSNKLKVEVIKVAGVTTDSQVDNLSINEKQTSVSYIDGLGRTIQHIEQKASPDGKDVIQPIVFDNNGRTSTTYLPYVSANTSGVFVPSAIAEQQSFYSPAGTGFANVAKDNAPFSVTKFDNSPLDLVIEQGAVGADWQIGTTHTAKMSYRVNVTADNVINWTVAGPGTNFAEQELSVNETINEQGNKFITFSDKAGKVLLKKEWLDESIAEVGNTGYVEYLETYYVYDDLGRLVYQIPPKALSKLKAGATWNSGFINEWIFKYTYDKDGRLIEKKTPDAGPVYTIYDQLDRAVMTQDAKMRLTNKWYFTKFDSQKRPTQQGIYAYSEIYSGSGLSAAAQLQKYFDELDYDAPGIYYYEKRQSGTTHGYSNQVFPTTNTTLLTLNYYDDYDLNNDGTADYNYVNPVLSGADTHAHSFIQGQLTASKTLVLGTSTWLTFVVFYDQYGRAIEKQSNNHVYSTGLNDIQSITYDGLLTVPKLVKQVKTTAASTSITITNRFVYDHRDRLKQTFQSNNGAAEQLVGQYAYNEIGQLTDKSLHEKSGGGFLQSVDFRYTIRGWLSRINNSGLSAEADDNGVNDVFGMEMVYNTAISGLTSTPDLRFDGRLSAVKWKTNDIQSSSTTPIYERSYRYQYDKTGRLKAALYAANNGSNWLAEAGGYDERNITYDQNGNMLSLKRFSINNGTSTPILIDDLSYTYGTGHGNQLKQVEDASGNAQGFKESAHVTDEYVYDENGNLVTDHNKGNGTTAMTINYNEINKTSRVDFPNGDYILYTYTATGLRIKKETHGSSTVKVTDYIDGFVYENATLAYLPMPEGRVRNAAGVFVYEYNLTDQQGNVRVSFREGTAGVAEVIQENHFYPFGLAMKGAIMRTTIPVTANKNLYNGGSELQDDFGDDPNWLSTPWREYDPALAKFHAVDPMADKYGSLTPYNYAFNDPITFNDPSGADASSDRIDGKQNMYEFYGSSGGLEGGFGYDRQRGPGSGDHWADGMGMSDWSAMTGSNMFRAGLAAGLQERGGNLYSANGIRFNGSYYYETVSASDANHAGVEGRKVYVNSESLTSGNFVSDNWKDIAFMVNDFAQAFKSTINTSVGYNLPKTTVFLPFGLATRVSTNIMKPLSSIGRGIAKVAPWVAGGAVVINVLSNKRITAGDVYQATVIGLSLIPGAGLVVGGLALAAEGISYYFTGKSVSDNINSSVGNGGEIVSWK
jgi:RHS repeat-associated protein